MISNLEFISFVNIKDSKLPVDEHHDISLRNADEVIECGTCLEAVGISDFLLSNFIQNTFDITNNEFLSNKKRY